MKNITKTKEYTIEEAEKIVPKECWASEYTEDERLTAINEYIDKIGNYVKNIYQPIKPQDNIELKKAKQTVEVPDLDTLADMLEDLYSDSECTARKIWELFAPHLKDNNKIRREAVEKLIKTLLCIEGVVSSDLMSDMEMKVANKRKITQEEAKEMEKLLTDIYHLTHNVVADCCRNRHNDLLENTYQALIKFNDISKDTLKETIEEYLKKEGK
jgi:predicted nucleic acid-binding protein